MTAGESGLEALRKDIVSCKRCPRLRAYCTQVAKTRRRAFMDWSYWGKPVPGFGDPQADLLVIGLAPAAHGANRTGRLFTGDRSGDFLYRALHKTGFASQAVSRSRDDGLKLNGVYVTAIVRCAPPGNRPKPQEIRNCREYLARELEILSNLKAIVALGRLAFEGYLSVLQDRGLIPGRGAFRFAHDREHRTAVDQPLLISSYHPSQQNTQTGRLTEKMFMDIFRRARRSVAGSKESQING